MVWRAEREMVFVSDGVTVSVHTAPPNYAKKESCDTLNDAVVISLTTQVIWRCSVTSFLAGCSLSMMCIKEDIRHFVYK